jgi:hypothetical protein
MKPKPARVLKPKPAPAPGIVKQPKPPGVYAKFETPCFKCRRLILIGTRIHRVRERWKHHECPDRGKWSMAAERAARSNAYWDAEYRRVAELRKAQG